MEKRVSKEKNKHHQHKQQMTQRFSPSKFPQKRYKSLHLQESNQSHGKIVLLSSFFFLLSSFSSFFLIVLSFLLSFPSLTCSQSKGNTQKYFPLFIILRNTKRKESTNGSRKTYSTKKGQFSSKKKKKKTFFVNIPAPRVRRKPTIASPS